MTEHTRKIKQIATSGGTVYALCNDGSVWRNMGGSGDWFLLYGIPAAP